MERWAVFQPGLVLLMETRCRPAAGHQQLRTNGRSSFLSLQGSSLQVHQLWWWRATNCTIIAANAVGLWVCCALVSCPSPDNRTRQEPVGVGGHWEGVWSPAALCYCCCCCSRRRRKVAVREVQVGNGTRWLWSCCLSTGGAAGRKAERVMEPLSNSQS